MKEIMTFFNCRYYVCQKTGENESFGYIGMDTGHHLISLRRVCTTEEQEGVRAKSREICGVTVPMNPKLIRKVSNSSDILCGISVGKMNGKKFKINTLLSRIDPNSGNLVREYSTGDTHYRGTRLTDVKMLKKGETRFLTTCFRSSSLGVYHIEKSDPIKLLENVSEEKVSALSISQHHDSIIFVGNQAEKLIVYDLTTQKILHSSTGLGFQQLTGGNYYPTPFRRMHKRPSRDRILGHRRDSGTDVICEIDSSSVLFGSGVTIHLYDWRIGKNDVKKFILGEGTGCSGVSRLGCVYNDEDKKFMVLDTGGSVGAMMRATTTTGNNRASRLKIFDLRKSEKMVKVLEGSGECTGISKIRDDSGKVYVMSLWNGKEKNQSRIYSFSGDGDVKIVDEGKNEGNVSCLEVLENERSGEVWMRFREDRRERILAVKKLCEDGFVEILIGGSRAMKILRLLMM